MIRFPAVDLLTPERETALARAIEAGVVADHALGQPWRTDGTAAELQRIAAEGRQAWEHFLLANLRLVADLARHAAARSGLDFDELFQEGCLVLGHALRRFDHTRGRFSTYAFRLINQHLARVTSSLVGQLGVPGSRALAQRRALSLAAQLGQELGRPADLAEISEALGRDPDWTARLLRHRPPLPLEAIDQLPASDPGGFEGWEDRVLAARVAPAVRRLPGDQRLVLELRFGFVDGRCHSFREIAQRLDLSAASVRRIERRGLAALRHRHAPPIAADELAG